MSDASVFELTLQGIEAAATIAKEFLSFNIGKEASAKAIEMNTVILTTQRHALAAQAREMELTNRISTFEKEVMQLKDWNVEKEDYELQSIGGTAFEAPLKMLSGALNRLESGRRDTGIRGTSDGANGLF